MEEDTTDKNKQSGKSRNLILLGIIGVAVLIIGGGFFFLSNSKDSTTVTVNEEQKSVTELNPDAEIKTFEMSAKQWEFSPSTITVNQGDIVRLNITSVDVTHGFAISDFGVNVMLKPNTTSTAEFIADKKGTFRFFCSISCGAGHAGMVGELIVE